MNEHPRVRPVRYLEATPLHTTNRNPRQTTPTPKRYEAYTFLQVVETLQRLEQKCKSLEERIHFLEQQSGEQSPASAGIPLPTGPASSGDLRACAVRSQSVSETTSTTCDSAGDYSYSGNENGSWCWSLEEAFDVGLGCEAGEMPMEGFVQVVRRDGIGEMNVDAFAE
ncbi:hypothetical protein N7539_003078 [Penicillium diatomitis]|uniref:Uncharacterized protein n=1 Tax=Penicillium diatomitis TaxID=2819901 RepID=A0A9W9XFX5_9EURO|nr:uncharacterized protein N7539_003078 [Penicillium diatomitis]KAJ5491511.1 hypothetical protein N7539_003078 [Penicillium diatomitis]